MQFEAQLKDYGRNYPQAQYQVAEAGGNLYRGTADGRIYPSANSGKSWRLHTNFGPDFSVWGLVADSHGRILAQLGFAGHSMHLSLMRDGRTWRTA